MQKQLADGLILRTLSEGFASDRERLPDFYATHFDDDHEPEVYEAFTTWTTNLCNHPTVSADDIFVIVDPAHDDRIVTATLLIPQTWRYEEVELSVGRPELVATHPEYRGRGLVRTIFNAIHERSEAMGHEIQVITGIPYFYRQFGYAMAMDLGSRASLPLAVIKEPKDHNPSFTLRLATVDDIDDILGWQAYQANNVLMSEVRSATELAHELSGHHPRSLRARSYQIIVNNAGEGVGYVELSNNLLNPNRFYCQAYVVGEKASYVETFDDVMLAIRAWMVATFGQAATVLYFAGGSHQSIYQLVNYAPGGRDVGQAYKWYVRVPDAVAFFRHIQPVLERRLVGSGAHGYTGEFKIGFHNLRGISFKFEQGRIVDISAITGKDGYDLSFPWQFLWNLVFGDKSLTELMDFLPDVDANGRKAVVLGETLFPKKPSWLEGMA